MTKFVNIKMTETTAGSPNGYEVFTYHKGSKYDVPESLAKVFCDGKLASKVSTGKSSKAGKTKASTKTVENKMLDEPVENKNDETAIDDVE